MLLNQRDYVSRRETVQLQPGTVRDSGLHKEEIKAGGWEEAVPDL